MIYDTILEHRFHVDRARRSVSPRSTVVAKLFGLAFLVAGVAILYFGLTMEMADSQTGKPSSLSLQLAIVAVCGIPFLALGLAAVLGRGGVVIDRNGGVVELWFGLAHRERSASLSRIDSPSRVSCERSK